MINSQIIDKILWETYDKYVEKNVIIKNKEYFKDYLVFMVKENKDVINKLEMMLKQKNTLFTRLGVQLYLRQYFNKETKKYIEMQKVKKYLTNK